MVVSFRMKANQAAKGFIKDERANAHFGHIGQHALVIAAVIVGAVVALILISTLFPTFAGAVKNLSQNVTTADFGNTTANSLGPVFGLLISLGGLFAIVGLAFLAYTLKGKGKA